MTQSGVAEPPQRQLMVDKIPPGINSTSDFFTNKYDFKAHCLVFVFSLAGPSDIAKQRLAEDSDRHERGKCFTPPTLKSASCSQLPLKTW